MRILTPYFTRSTFPTQLFDEVDRMWNHLYDFNIDSNTCEMNESEEHFMMSFDLPGMKKEDLKIDINNNVLTLSGERKRASQKNYGQFTRSFTLPQTVDTEKIEAQYEDGVLELYLPKTKAAKSRQIQIQSPKTGFFSQLLSSGKNSNEAIDVKKN